MYHHKTRCGLCNVAVGLFSTWHRSMRPSIVRCSLQSRHCLRRHWMSQKMKDSLELGGFNHSAGHKWALNWLDHDSYLSRHQLKEIWRHGQAGSVNIETVEEEQACVRELLASFWPEDCWNVDKTALFAFAPPDCGLSQQQMSGKQANKFHLTICLACNADGSQKRKIFFIGKSKKACCFGRQGPTECGF